MNFQMAQRRFALDVRACSVCAACCILGGVAVFHTTVWQVIGVIATVSTLSSVILVVGLPWRGGEKQQVQTGPMRLV